MFKRYWLYAWLLFAVMMRAQAPAPAATKYAIATLPIGGKDQVEQVLQTQLTLPKALLTSHFEADITAYFDIDSTGKAVNIKLDGATNNALRNEMKRIFNFWKFVKGQNAYGDPYTINIKLSAEKYSRYFKQRNKLNLKKPLPADSSYAVYSRADVSPEYYKNGDEGLAELVLSEMEYPKLAIEKSVEGTVVLEFVVETNGYITDIIPRKNVGAGCTEEAIRVIKLSRWQPAILNNKLVRYKTTYPITFSLRNINKDNTSASGQ